MPNWCYQHLKVQGTKDQLKQFKKAMLAQHIKENEGKRPKKGDEAAFTFGLFKEFPPILNACDMLCGTNGSNNQQPVGNNRKIILDECGDSVLMPTPGKDKENWDIDPKKLSKYLEETYDGDTGWSSWNCSNWGTKWNACDVRLKEETDEELHYYYETAWSPALPALEYATTKYPELTFRVTYTEESDACAGIVVLHGGDVVIQREIDPNMDKNGYLQEKYLDVLLALASMGPDQLAQVEGTIDENFEWDGDYFSSGILNSALRAVLSDELHVETFAQDLIKVLELKFDDPEAIEVLSNSEAIIVSEEELSQLITSAKPEVIQGIQELFITNAKEFNAEKVEEECDSTDP